MAYYIKAEKVMRLTEPLGTTERPGERETAR
jgi:hypothetical protein